MRPCGRDLFELIPKRELRVDLDRAAKILRKSGFRVSEQSELVLSMSDTHDISIFPNGKILVFPVKTGEEAEVLGNRILGAIEKDKKCIKYL